MIDQFTQLERDVAESEGFRRTAYQDEGGVWTIGYGTNLQELEIDEQTARQWRTRHLVASAADAERFPWYLGLSPARQRAVVELIYNMGLTRYRGFVKHLAAMACGDFETAAAELLASKWRGQVKEARAQRLALQIRNG